MEEKNIKIRSRCDGLMLDIMMFIPKDKDSIKGIVQIAHGMAEHKERYYDFMKYLTDNGYVAIINDHRGHGLSIKNDEDLGYFYDKDGTYIVNDLVQISKYVKEMYPDKKLILMGHSMGSLVVRKYIKENDNLIDKLIVCGSPSRNNMAGMGLLLSKIIGKVRGDKYRSKFIQGVVFGRFNKGFINAKSANSWICSIDDIVDKYDKDELCGFIFTTNGFINLFHLMKDVYSNKGWLLNNKDLPIIFIAGSDDPVIVSEKKWLDSQCFLEKIGYNNIKRKLYKGSRHEILNDKDKDIVYKDILEFIEN